VEAEPVAGVRSVGTDHNSPVHRRHGLLVLRGFDNEKEYSPAMNSAILDTSPAGDDPPSWDDVTLAQLRKELLRFAFLQLRNRDLAEDVVQEALAAAFAARQRFEQRASVKTWVFKILKNKIVDHFRDRWNKDRVELAGARAGNNSDSDSNNDDQEFDALFESNEQWRPSTMPTSWSDPEQSFENHEFWVVFETCMTKLPEAGARVFSMREFLGLEVDEICKELAIKQSNCWVLLHRARMHLRLCLQKRWFEKVGGK
jgi:RNA polymerase sigma-70 factor (TIGR02943 family)